MKRRIRLTEGDLHRIVRKSVGRLLREDVYGDAGVWDALDRLRECMDDETIAVRIISRLGPYEAARILNDIISVECPEDGEEEI